MAKGAIIRVTGLSELKKKFKTIPQDVATEVDMEMAAAANNYVNKAVEAAPVDQSELRQKISSDRKGLMQFEIVSAAPHSAFLEFGTRSRVQIPADLMGYAAQFKGKKSGGDAKKAIYEWCRRHGIEQKLWYPIFLKIMTVGINPHPFFFKQREPVITALQQKLKPALKRALNK